MKIQSNVNIVFSPERLHDTNLINLSLKGNKTMSNEKKKQIHELLDYLLSHNKNYTKAQYYKLLELAELLSPEVHDNAAQR